jgi:hypothetical protein
LAEKIAAPFAKASKKQGLTRVDGAGRTAIIFSVRRESKSIAATPVRRYHFDLMNMFSRMFPKPPPKRKSFVIPWADKRRKQVESQEKKFTPEVVSAGFVYYLSTFGKIDPNNESGAHFASDNDAALFEVGCYMFFYFDVMLAKNHPHLRDQYSRVLFWELASVFSQAFQDKEIGGLIQERINNYCDFFRAKEDATVYENRLFRLIEKAHGNRKPEPWQFDNEPMLYGNMNELLKMKIGFIAWAKVFMEVLEQLNQGLRDRQGDG